MAVSGKVSGEDWSVSVEVVRVPDGFVPAIHVIHNKPKGKFEHHFKHHKVSRTEREAVLEGLREGMGWIGQKMANIFSI
ncbi:hypothetical protein [Trinickia dinghuensis]|uniref:UDP-glucose 4-epimerase n=1 Tax=Trinickia dinghuensis TaxID=2291023 RepID=A0A3D8K3C6_9BURK|nr:hypothetical protein [Trinickia dinghuensis]RDU99354.1 hypothetical protein DWV00_09630 [Trinickia dinghuensis]